MLLRCWAGMVDQLYPFKPTRCNKASFYIPENVLIFHTTKGFWIRNFMKLAYQHKAIFFNLSSTSSHFYPLQVENCGSNSRIVVDKNDNGKFRFVNHLFFSGLKGLKQHWFDISCLLGWNQTDNRLCSRCKTGVHVTLWTDTRIIVYGNYLRRPPPCTLIILPTASC